MARTRNAVLYTVCDLTIACKLYSPFGVHVHVHEMGRRKEVDRARQPARGVN
jgi:hypothetical protein